MIKLSVSETKWSSLLASTQALIPYISIWVFDFAPKKLPGLSRNVPQDRRIDHSVTLPPRLQNSPYFRVFKYARAVKRGWKRALRACEARALCARKTLTPRFTDFFTDFEKKNRLFYSLAASKYNKII